tara:strand:+ start:30 stop:215 length:186 start_codon:yes stop_codon:yes gene_type:complete
MKQLWKLESVNIKVTDHNGNIRWYDNSDLIANDTNLENELEYIINKKGGTFDEEEVGKKDD